MDETQRAGREEEEGEGHERRTQEQGELVGGGRGGGCSDSSDNIESQSFSQEVRGLLVKDTVDVILCDIV